MCVCARACVCVCVCVRKNCQSAIMAHHKDHISGHYKNQENKFSILFLKF